MRLSAQRVTEPDSAIPTPIAQAWRLIGGFRQSVLFAGPKSRDLWVGRD
jgi:hypothetical protein